jgi:hypothetical protein
MVLTLAGCLDMGLRKSKTVRLSQDFNGQLIVIFARKRPTDVPQHRIIGITQKRDLASLMKCKPCIGEQPRSSVDHHRVGRPAARRGDLRTESWRDWYSHRRNSSITPKWPTLRSVESAGFGPRRALSYKLLSDQLHWRASELVETNCSKVPMGSFQPEGRLILKLPS